MIQQPKFDVPQAKQLTLSRPIFVKGRGLPPDGVCLFNQGQIVTVETDNGANWYIRTTYRRREFRVAVMPSTL